AQRGVQKREADSRTCSGHSGRSARDGNAPDRVDESIKHPSPLARTERYTWLRNINGFDKLVHSRRCRISAISALVIPLERRSSTLRPPAQGLCWPSSFT